MEDGQLSPGVPTPVAATAAPPPEESRTVANGASAVRQQTEEPRADAETATPCAQPACWNAGFWSYPHHAALQFASEADLDAAIDLLWNAPELRGLPRVHVGDNTMIVPAEAVDVLRTKTRPFVVKPVVSAGELPPAEAAQIRRAAGA